MRALVIYISGPVESGVRPINLTDGKSVVVGRAAGADVVLAEDRSVSSRHARISCCDDVVKLEDLGSRNGTFVNGSSISNAVLNDLDEVRIGACIFRLKFERDLDISVFSGDAPSQKETNDHAMSQGAQVKFSFDSLDIHSGMPTPDADEFWSEVATDEVPAEERTMPSTARREISPPGVVSRGTLTIEFQLPDGELDKLFVRNGQKASVGSGSKADYRLDFPELAAIHFKLRMAHDVATIVDANSKSGTFLNGQKIRSAELQNGDKIEAGHVTFRVVLPDMVQHKSRSSVSVAFPSGPPVENRKIHLYEETRSIRSEPETAARIQANQSRDCGTGLVAIEGSFENASVEQLVKFCQSFMGGFQLLTDFGRLAEQLPDPSEHIVFFPTESENIPQRTAIDGTADASTMAATYGSFVNRDGAVGIATGGKAAETVQVLKQLGGPWAIGWPGMVRAACEAGNRKEIESLFQSVAGIIVESDLPGDWMLFTTPERFEQLEERLVFEPTESANNQEKP